jgi:hypothetical protein
MANKRQRVPLSEYGRKPLQEPPGLDKKKYHYHWINDQPGNVEAAIAGGYSHVETTEKTVGGDVTEKHSIVGSKATGMRQYLMKIPIELYQEDLQNLEQRNKAVDAAIARQEFQGSTLENAYTPEGGGIKSSIKHTME